MIQQRGSWRARCRATIWRGFLCMAAVVPAPSGGATAPAPAQAQTQTTEGVAPAPPRPSPGLRAASASPQPAPAAEIPTDARDPRTRPARGDGQERDAAAAPDLAPAPAETDGAIGPPPGNVSSLAAGRSAAMQVNPPDGALRLDAASPSLWDESNLESPTAPENRRGQTPTDLVTDAQALLGITGDKAAADRGVGSGNFMVSVPLLQLPGRGQDLALDLTYNSRVWQRRDLRGTCEIIGPEGEEICIGQMLFDVDRDWPAPGWNMGFGKLVWAGKRAMLIDPDGSRHTFPEEEQRHDGWAYFTGTAGDGSLIEATYAAELAGPRLESGSATYPNGTFVVYDVPGRPMHPTLPDIREIYPSRITDRNGNSITIKYLTLPDGREQGPEISTIRDTLGRTVEFAYGYPGTPGEGRLVAITQPGLADDLRRVVVRFHYDQFHLGMSKLHDPTDPAYKPRLEYIGQAFDLNSLDELTPVIAPESFSRIDAITFPGTGDGYYFAHPDTWSPYGMMRRVSQQRGMAVDSPDVKNQGNVTQGMPVRDVYYDYPAGLARLSDAPTYRTMTEVWAANGPEQDRTAITQYGVTDEDGKPVPYLKRGRGQYYLEVRYPGGTWSRQPLSSIVPWTATYDQHGRPLRRTDITWEQGANGPRRKVVMTTDERGQVTSTDYGYGANDLQVQDVSERDYDGTLLRQTHTEFLPRRWDIQNLPKLTVVRDPHLGDIAGTEYGYDEFPLEPTPEILQHHPRGPDSTPEAPGGLRGNLTRITRHNNVDGRLVTETRRYDAAGNMIASVLGSRHRRFTYTKDTQYAYPTRQSIGASDGSPAVTVATSGTYHVRTGQIRTSTDANGRTTRYDYDPASLRLLAVHLPTGATRTYDYNDAGLRSQVTVRESGGAEALSTVTHVDGRGLPARVESLAPNGGWDVVETRYDRLGRAIMISRPFCRDRSGCDNKAQFWTETEYDALGRVEAVRAPDGSLTTYTHNAHPRGTPGQTLQSVDPWGNVQWSRQDALGRLVEVVDPVGSHAHYRYTGLDQLYKVELGTQVRCFEHDALGRLIRQRLPERNATVAGQGRDCPEGWTDAFAYDDQDNLIEHIDSRGVRTAYRYDGDPLDRLQRVEFSGGDDSVSSAPTVHYSYVSSGDVTRPEDVTTEGIVREHQSYDIDGRPTVKTITLLGSPGTTWSVDRSYDTLSRATGLRYPEESRQGGGPRQPDPRPVAEVAFAAGGLPSGLNVDGVTYGSHIGYDPAASVTQLRLDPVAALETYGHEPATGLLESQSVRLGDQVALDLSYGYQDSKGHRTGQLVSEIDRREPRRSRHYGYDTAGRLTTARGGPSKDAALWHQDYNYDRYGNRTTTVAGGTDLRGRPIPTDGLPSLTYHETSNRIANPGFSYDAVGNLTRRVAEDGTALKFRYDAAGRLVAVLGDDDQPLETYSYYRTSRERLWTEDARVGRRTYSVWSGGHVIAEYTGADRGRADPLWALSYVYLGNRLLATRAPTARGPGSNTVVQFHHPDRLGTRLLTRIGSDSAIEQLTLPFGTSLEPTKGELSETSIRFTNYHRSERTGLDYALNRFYDSQEGRFIQVDPIGPAASDSGDPQSLNLYGYVRNDPVNSTDPAGLMDSPGVWFCRQRDITGSEGGNVFYTVAWNCVSFSAVEEIGWSNPFAGLHTLPGRRPNEGGTRQNTRGGRVGIGGAAGRNARFGLSQLRMPNLGAILAKAHWTDVLPPCPCTEADAAKSGSGFIGGVGGCPSFPFHPEATSGYRSERAYSSSPGTHHGQQCCYDARDKLITEGAAAGTADLWHPSFFFLHQKHDVLPWLVLASKVGRYRAWERYNVDRPTNKGSTPGGWSCPDNKVP